MENIEKKVLEKVTPSVADREKLDKVIQEIKVKLEKHKLLTELYQFLLNLLVQQLKIHF
jgi:hypothetical protein